MAKLKIGETAIGLAVTSVLSRGRVFVMFFEGETIPVLLPKVIAAEDGYVHRTMFAGLKLDVTPTAESTGTNPDGTKRPGFLATVELPMASYNTNTLLAARQNTANNYAMAKLYAVAAVDEN